jgi:hypothetical protein
VIDEPLEVDPVARFLVVMKPESFIRHGERRFQVKGADYLRGLREATGFLDPVRYRGMGREPVDERGTLRESFERFKQLGLDASERVLPTIELAERVLATGSGGEEWEIVYASNIELARTPRTLGYDLGSLQKHEFYSLISDCLVVPTWHGPDPGDFQALANNVHSLNEDVLFQTPSDARAFRAWYVTRTWAEAEVGHPPFTAVRIDDIAGGGSPGLSCTRRSAGNKVSPSR